MKDETHKRISENDNQNSDFDYHNYATALADNNLFKSGLGAFLSWFASLMGEIKTSGFWNRVGLWLPVFYGLGILYGFENTLTKPFYLWALLAVLFLGLILFFLLYLLPKYSLQLLYRLVQFGFVFVLGIMVAHLRVYFTDTIFINSQTEIKHLEGQIINIDASYSELPRITVKLSKLNGANQDIVKTVRLNLKNNDGLKVGDIIACDNGILLPPSPPTIPDGYDFARKMWFKGIGGVGNCKSLQILSSDSNAIHEITTYVNKVRKYASYQITNGNIGGGRGLLAALVTGDRSYIAKIENDNMQVSGLGHIVSISGLHVALVSGIIYLFFVKLLALSEALALRIDIRKISATLSIFVSLFYVVFTGLETPAVRAFFMSLLVFGAIIFDRKAINMRGLAMAALIILSAFPESVFDAGFTMSFMATMALISLWEKAEWKKIYNEAHIFGRILVWIIGAILVSFVAGLATTPIVLNSFGRLNIYSVFSNLLAAPINDFIIGPFAILATFFSIFNIGQPFWAIAAWGCDLILAIADFTAKLPFANENFTRLGNSATFVCFLAICWFCVFNNKIRYFAIIGLMVGFLMYLSQPEPVLLIATNGKAAIAVEKDYSSYNQICYAKSGQFYARQILNYSPFSDTKKDEMREKINHNYVNMCRLKSGDWEAHYINYQKNNPILSLTFDNKTYAFDKNNAPNGAILQRRGWRLELYVPKSKETPWGNGGLFHEPTQ